MIKIVKTDRRSIWHKAADIISEKIDAVIASSQKTLLLLSAGSAVNIYPLFAEKLKNLSKKPHFLTIAQADERFQPENKEDINAYQIEKSGLTFYAVDQKGTMEESAQKYNQTISKLYKNTDFRIAILGIGDDGHTVGLLPGYRKLWDKDTFAVGYENKGRFPQRITLTPKAFQQCNFAVVCLAGKTKKQVLWKLERESEEGLNIFPASILYSIPEAVVLADAKNPGY
ncbi:hypothetical protein A3G68_03360 [Candidatus Gottesmanbacteria bacterium RIFCSPLOWO2_12_FULL_42_10]|nr:MAG: hypothetical protein A3G68_03360 [Candidatus Gottesmanbacteria bacterium RIFCSPLOWO2_12_FULL_42_10]